MGLISADGSGQKNPNRSESPWGGVEPYSKAAQNEESSARHRTGKPNLTLSCAKGRRKPGVHRRMPATGLSDWCSGKALSDMPAFQPYWGKPAVRNDRGDGGNVGIIRSPLRATVLPDYRKGSSESILASSLAGDIVRCRVKRRQRYRWAGY